MTHTDAQTPESPAKPENFQVGDRVNRDPSNHPDATVTALTERGFRWRLDAPQSLGPRHGSFQEGEAYTDQPLHGWRVVKAARPTPT